MTSNKTIQISSSFDIQSESLHEKIRDPSTGKGKTIDIEEPHRATTTTTITSNPVKYETNGDEPHVTEGKDIELNPATVGYDASQL